MKKRFGTSRRGFLAASGKLLAAGSLTRLERPARNALGSPAPPERARVPVIDCHAHVGISRLAGSRDDLTDPWYAIADPQTILQHAREAGIDKTVIFPIFNTTYKEANEELARICRRYPGKFIGFAKHNPKTEKGQMRSLLEREYHELGLRGLKLHDQPTPELLDVVKELNIPVLYHPRRVAVYEEFLPSYPTISFIMAHLGSDTSEDYEEHLAAIDLAKRFPNVYLETSSVLLTRYIAKAVDELGWMSARPPSPSNPFFVWIHLYDPHTPYDPPPRFRALRCAAFALIDRTHIKVNIRFIVQGLRNRLEAG